MIWKNLVFFWGGDLPAFPLSQVQRQLSKVLYVSYIHHHYHLTLPSPTPSLNYFNSQEHLKNPPRPEPPYQP